MKKLLFTLTLAGALALGGQSAFAQAKKKSAEKQPAEAPAAAAEKPKAAPAAEKPKANKPIPMYVHADEIDAAAKTITQVAKDGKKSTNSVTATTIIENDKKTAKFEDIKVGDMVSGNRTKTGDGTYDIVKITKFGAKAEKPAGGAKKPAGDAKKPAEKKADAPAKPAAQ
ncbi:MAG: hypothetical protein NTV08_15310 [Verrucomicrobia bacterium]|nr:hypothetical protein [Verrucomicrobiota bacterium]